MRVPISSQLKSTQPSQAMPKVPVSAEDRRRMIAKAAYFRALNRGFRGGDINDDWYRAETQISAALDKPKAQH